jgi:hypothetical protein
VVHGRVGESGCIAAIAMDRDAVRIANPDDGEVVLTNNNNNNSSNNDLL